MKKIYFIFAFAGCLFASDALHAQVYTSFSTGFDNVNDQNDWTMYREGDAGFYDWGFGNFGYSVPNSLDHDYPVGGSVLTDDWFVSNQFAMNHGGKIDSIRHNFSGFGVPGPGDTVAIYLLVGSPDPSLASSKILLKDFRGADYNGNGNWYVTTDINIPATAGNCYIAFRYTTVANWLDVQFDNLFIRTLQFAGVEEPANDNIKVYPNPANEQVYIQLDNVTNAYFQLYDASGKQIMNKLVQSGTSVQLEQAAGIYSYRITSVDGKLLKNHTLIVTNH